MLSIFTKHVLAFAVSRKRGGIIVNEHTLTKEQTRLHVDVLGRYFNFIALDELGSRVAQPAQRPFCLLTFDDGKRSNATEVAPELERLGVPAAFYLTTDFVGHGTPLWFDRQKALQCALGYCPPGLEVETLKQLPFAVLSERLDRACAEYAISPDLMDGALPMSWDEARTLSSNGFAFGAHGRTHAILTNETRENACAEIEESIAAVSAELGSRCTSFAFPNGNYTSELARHAVDCGASTVMTTDPSWVERASAFWRLPRVQLFGTFTRARIELKIALAGLRGVLRNPNGTGRALMTNDAMPNDQSAYV